MRANSARHSHLVSPARLHRLITRRCLRTPTKCRSSCPPSAQYVLSSKGSQLLTLTPSDSVGRVIVHTALLVRSPRSRPPTRSDLLPGQLPNGNIMDPTPGFRRSCG